MSAEVMYLECAFSIDQIEALELALAILDRGTEDAKLLKFVFHSSESTISYLESFAQEQSAMWRHKPIPLETIQSYRARLLMYLARHLNSPSMAVVHEVLETVSSLVQQCADGYAPIFLERLELLASSDAACTNWKLALRLGCLIARFTDGGNDSHFGRLTTAWGWWCVPLWRATNLSGERPWDALKYLGEICEQMEGLCMNDQCRVRTAVGKVLGAIEILALMPEASWYEVKEEFACSLAHIYPYLDVRQRETFYRAVWNLQRRGLVDARQLAIEPVDQTGRLMQKLLSGDDESFWEDAREMFLTEER